jgi:uncharacterized protein (DUF2147 family)
MKRFSYALVLMLLSSTAHARDYSFSIGGHRIHVEAARHCRSLSCLSWSEVGARRAHRADDDGVMPAPAAPAPVTRPLPVAPACPPAAVTPPAPAVVAPAPSIVTPAPAPAALPAARPAETTASLALPKPASPRIELAAADARPVPKTGTIIDKPDATMDATVTGKPAETPDWARDWSPPKDAPAIRAEVKRAKSVVHADESAIGDWQTKKGLIRIETCGAALCGYVLNQASNTTGETVLSNMKPNNDTQWSGDIFSRASGNTYHARMTLKQPDTLWVEACAIGRLFCSGNAWTRLPGSDDLITSRDLPATPRS